MMKWLKFPSLFVTAGGTFGSNPGAIIGRVRQVPTAAYKIGSHRTGSDARLKRIPSYVGSCILQGFSYGNRVASPACSNKQTNIQGPKHCECCICKPMGTPMQAHSFGQSVLRSLQIFTWLPADCKTTCDAAAAALPLIRFPHSLAGSLGQIAIAAAVVRCSAMMSCALFQVAFIYI